jgi:hypothetical protein
MLNAITPSVVVLSVGMLGVLMLSVVAPNSVLTQRIPDLIAKFRLGKKGTLGSTTPIVIKLFTFVIYECSE